MDNELTKALTEALVAATQTVRTGSKVHVDLGATNLQPTTWITGSGMFSPCGPAQLITSMVVDNALSQWLGAFPTVEEPARVGILSYVGPYGTAAGSEEIWTGRTAECDEPPGVEYGKCELLYCLGEVARAGGDLSALRFGLNGCTVAPRHYVSGPFIGQTIDDERLVQLAMAATVALQDYERMNIVGNQQTNAMHWDGLQRLINTPIYDYRTGARCEGEEPLIQDWASAAMDATICDMLTAIVRRIRMRARFLGGVRQGDMVLLMTSLMRDALIDFAGCGCGPCTGTAYHEVNIDALAARTERARLATGGTFGMGMFEVDGMPVDILTSDWIPQTSSAPYFCSDIFVLTRQVGGERILYNEYQDFSKTLAGLPVELLTRGRVTDNGRFLVLSQNVHECFNEELFMRSRIVLRAPWLQARLTNVCAPFELPPMVPAAGDAYFPFGNPPANVAAYAATPYTYGPCEGF